MIKKIFKWLAIAIGTFLVVVLAVNLAVFDEKLNPGLVQLVESYKLVGADTPDGENAFFSLLAIEGPADQDLPALGRKIAGDFEQALAAGHDYAKVSDWLDNYRKAYGLETFHLQGEGDAPVDFATPGALARSLDNVEAGKRLVELNRDLLARYQRLLQYRYYVEKMSPYLYGPASYPPPVLHRLFLADTALAVAAGDIQSAVDRLNQDSRFLRKVLAGASLQPITKLVAAKLLREDFMLLSEVIGRGEDAGTLPLGPIQEILRPLSDTELSFKAVWQAQTAAAFHIPDLASESCTTFNTCLVGLLYQRQATINHAYEASRKYGRIFSLSATELARLTPAEEQQYSTTAMPPVRLYNPVGTILLGEMVFGFTPAMFRMYNLEGFRRLVALQLAIREAGVAREDVAAFVGSAGEAYCNPYTNGPMAWNAQEGRLVFKGFEALGETKDFAVRL